MCEYIHEKTLNHIESIEFFIKSPYQKERSKLLKPRVKQGLQHLGCCIQACEGRFGFSGLTASHLVGMPGLVMGIL